MIDKDKFMKEQIESLTELEKVQLVHRILGNMRANELFEPKGEEPIYLGVLEAAYTLLNDWMEQDNDILRIEYNRFLVDKENKSQAENKVINETNKLGWEKGKIFEELKDKNDDKWKVDHKRSSEDWTTVNYKRQKTLRKKMIQKGHQESIGDTMRKLL